MCNLRAEIPGGRILWLGGGGFYDWGDAIFNPFQWVFDTSPQFIRGRVPMQNYCAERLAE